MPSRQRKKKGRREDIPIFRALSFPPLSTQCTIIHLSCSTFVDGEIYSFTIRLISPEFQVFMEPLKKVQVEGHIMMAEPEMLFGNLDELCCVNETIGFVFR